MQKQFTPCPACGAVGEVGSNCQFCGTSIILKGDAIASTELIPKVRTVTPQQYAEKISIYHNVKPAGELLIVSIGKQYGLINLNGDIIYPLGNDEIRVVSKDTIGLGYKRVKEIIKASQYWNESRKRWENEEAITLEEFETKKYFNLETGMYANKHGLIEDKDNPGKLYRVDVKKEWEPISTYTNLEGEVHSYDYVEEIKIPYIWRSFYHFYHNDGSCSLWIAEKYGIDRDALLEKDMEGSICVLEGIRNEYSYNKENEELLIQTIDGEKVTIHLNDQRNIRRDCIEIYKEWFKATKKHTKVLENIRKKIPINQKLLDRIKDYMQEIKADPECKKYVSFSRNRRTSEVSNLFLLINNGEYQSSNKGVCLAVRDKDMLKDCDLYLLFEKYQGGAYGLDVDLDKFLLMNYAFDAESLCASIQYLAECYGWQSDEIVKHAYIQGDGHTYWWDEYNGSDDNGSDDSTDEGGPVQWIIAVIIMIIGFIFTKLISNIFF